jgi:23S rRNA (adenine2503-C2)-methyltransferase
MGEPFLNYDSVEVAIRLLHKKYPNAQLLVSTIAPENDAVLDRFITLSKEIPKIGLQFSIHKSSDEERNLLIPFENKLPLKKIADYGRRWFFETGRRPYCNYCIDGKNNTEKDFKNLNELFEPGIFCFTFSVICAKDETMKSTAFRDLAVVDDFRNRFLNEGYDTRVFDPAGQDDIGGGCGQLWYVQKYLEKKNLTV